MVSSETHHRCAHADHLNASHVQQLSSRYFLLIPDLEHTANGFGWSCASGSYLGTRLTIIVCIVNGEHLQHDWLLVAKCSIHIAECPSWLTSATSSGMLRLPRTSVDCYTYPGCLSFGREHHAAESAQMCVLHTSRTFELLMTRY